MKTILLPTDFSIAAQAAEVYALQLAKKDNSNILLLHASPKSMIGHKNIDEAKAKLSELSDRLSTELPNRVSTHLSSLPTDQAIASLEKDKKFDWVVIGTHGVGGIKKRLFGSNTTAVLEHIKSPIMVIPASWNYKPINKILYATNFDYSDFKSLKALIIFAEKNKAQVEVIHVSDKDTEEEASFMKWYEDRARQEVNYVDLSFDRMEGHQPYELLLSKVINEGVDMLCLTKRSRNSISKWLDRGMTMRLVQAAKVPVLVFSSHGLQPKL
ncbi:MAG: universal stress protein [Cyclobacteriaceae bacterium]|nr:universal stress protein [Cyclobacteriaceae bacterium]MCH8515439.1 universal stress protein [Cyclobacteriaceae bacterium]